MSATQDIVAKLWKLCDVLRDDGVTYSEYVTELTYLLFLKMMAETGQERRIPEEYRWDTLAKREGLDQLTHYKHLLTSLGDPDERDAEGKPKVAKDPLVLAIFENAQKVTETATQGTRWRSDQVPQLVLALYHVVVGNYTIAPLYEQLTSQDLMSEAAREKRTVFLADLVETLFAPNSTTDR